MAKLIAIHLIQRRGKKGVEEIRPGSELESSGAELEHLLSVGAARRKSPISTAEDDKAEAPAAEEAKAEAPATGKGKHSGKKDGRNAKKSEGDDLL